MGYEGGDIPDWHRWIAEWDPTNGVLLNIPQIQGIVGMVAQVRNARISREFNELGLLAPEWPERCVFGHPETPKEIGQFPEFPMPMKLFAAITVTPSEVVPDTGATPCFWAHVLWLDSSVFGRLIGGSRELDIRCKCRFGRIRQTPAWISTDAVGETYRRVCLTAGDATEWLKRGATMAYSCAIVVINQLPNEGPMLPYESKLTLQPSRN